VIDGMGSDHVILSQNEVLLVGLGEKMFITDTKTWRHMVRDGARGEMIEREQNFAMVGQSFELIWRRCEILADNVIH
jgi:hypothetical protein